MRRPISQAGPGIEIFWFIQEPGRAPRFLNQNTPASIRVRGLKVMADSGWPVVFDATHSVQLPRGEGGASSGQPQFIEPLAAAAVAVGLSGIFVEVHDNPEKALSDGPNALRLDLLPGFLRKLRLIHEARRAADSD